MGLVRAFAALLVVATPAAAQDDVKKLIDQLSAKGATERIAAAEALAKLGPKAADAGAALEKRLADKDVAAAKAAGLALGSIGRPAFPRIRAGLIGRDSCDAAVLAIGAAGADGAELIPDMLRMFAKAVPKDGTCIRNAAEAMDEIGKPALPFLAEGMKQRGQSCAAADILGLMKDKKVVSSAWQALVDLAAKKAELSGSRGSAINALSALRALGGDAAPALIAIAADPKDDPGVRGQAINALGWIAQQDTAAKNAVSKLVNDKEAVVAAKAKEVLPRFK